MEDYRRVFSGFCLTLYRQICGRPVYGVNPVLGEYLDVELTEPSPVKLEEVQQPHFGLLNLFYYDEEANEYDKTGKLLPCQKSS